MKLAIINEDGWKKIFCPGCKETKPRGGMCGVWWSPVGVLVGAYMLCFDCSQKSSLLKGREASQFADSIEDALLEKYPRLIKKLPDGYTVGGPEHFSA